MAGTVAGTGQVGAGLVNPPAEVFPAALGRLAASTRSRWSAAMTGAVHSQAYDGGRVASSATAAAAGMTRRARTAHNRTRRVGR